MRPAAALLLALLLLGACAGRQQFVAAPETPDLEPDVELPAVEPALPTFRIELRGPVDKKILKVAERTGGVVVAAPISVERAFVAGAGTGRELRVVAVDPLAFRSVAPGSTRDAEFVWTALLGGRAVLTPEASRAMKFGSSGSIVVGRSELIVGAFADNGVPNLGDVMISDVAGRGARLGEPNEVIVGTEDGADLDAIEADLRNKIEGVENIRRLQPRASEPVPEPDPVGTVEGGLIGTMNFRILKSGFIEPDPSWVAANIVQGTVPILGNVMCHRLAFPQLVAALGEIEQEGLARHINVKQYGGCYVPRFIGRDPRRGLSMHAFGLAIDLNVASNLLGTPGDLDPRVVAIFEKWGFAWGGRWSHPDPMHFEVARLVET